MNQLVHAVNIYWAHENKIQTKSWISNFVGRAGGGGAFYRLNLSSQQCTKAIIVKHKLRCLQWLKFLLEKVNSSIELWHKLTLKVSKKNPAPSVLIPTRASTAPTKNRVLKAKFRCLKGVIFSQRGKLLFLKLFLCNLIRYSVFSIRWRQINYWILRHDGIEQPLFQTLK